MSTPTEPKTTSELIPVVTPTDSLDLSKTDARYAAYTSRFAAVARMIGSSPLTRYAAYTSDVGEGFRPVAHPLLVKACYGISWAYVIGDVAVESKKRFDATQDSMETLRHGSQRLVFNALASMFGPMYTIHTIVHLAQNALEPRNVSPAIKKWAPVAAGLAFIPALPFIFDHPVEVACEKTWDFFWPSKYAHAPHSTDKVSHLGTSVQFDDSAAVAAVPAPAPTAPQIAPKHTV